VYIVTASDKEYIRYYIYSVLARKIRTRTKNCKNWHKTFRGGDFNLKTIRANYKNLRTRNCSIHWIKTQTGRKFDIQLGVRLLYLQTNKLWTKKSKELICSNISPLATEKVSLAELSFAT